jgi:hypothetical protein
VGGRYLVPLGSCVEEEGEERTILCSLNWNGKTRDPGTREPVLLFEACLTAGGSEWR